MLQGTPDLRLPLGRHHEGQVRAADGGMPKLPIDEVGVASFQSTWKEEVAEVRIAVN